MRKITLEINRAKKLKLVEKEEKEQQHMKEHKEKLEKLNDLALTMFKHSQEISGLVNKKVIAIEEGI
jgi:hypothetical protein